MLPLKTTYATLRLTSSNYSTGGPPVCRNAAVQQVCHQVMLRVQTQYHLPSAIYRSLQVQRKPLTTLLQVRSQQVAMHQQSGEHLEAFS